MTTNEQGRDPSTGKFLPGNTAAQGNGRPTEYDEEMPSRLLKYFDKPLYVERPIEISLKNGGSKAIVKRFPNDIPFFEDFAAEVGVSYQTLLNWAEQHDRFFDAYTRCKEIQKKFLIINGLQGLYNPNFAIFTAKNITDMKDKTEVDFGDKREIEEARATIKSLLDKIEGTKDDE